MDEFIIRKASDRRAALIRLRAAQSARRILVMQQQEDRTLDLQGAVREHDAKIEMLSNAIRRHDQARNFSLHDNYSLPLSETLSSVGTRLIELRLKKQITLKSLGHRTGIPESTLCEYERLGYQKVSLRRLKLIATVLENWGR